MKLTLIVLLSLLVLACGCRAAHPLLGAKGYDVVRPQFVDIPVPEGFRYLRDKSYSFEYDWKKVRHGRLTYRGLLPDEEVRDFYREKMIGVNWREDVHTGGEKTTIIFEKGSGDNKERCVVTIYTIEDRTIVEIELDPVK